MEQRRIDFENKILPVLSEGAVCTLLYFHDSDHKDVLHQVSRVVTSLWNNSSKEEGLSHEAAGSSVMIVFEALEFKWATLEQVQNQPKFVGSASLSKIHVCEKNDVTVDGMKRCNLAFINRNKDKLLSLCSSWRVALGILGTKGFTRPLLFLLMISRKLALKKTVYCTINSDIWIWNEEKKSEKKKRRRWEMLE